MFAARGRGEGQMELCCCIGLGSLLCGMLGLQKPFNKNTCEGGTFAATIAGLQVGAGA
jgi:hypothetical protein